MENLEWLKNILDSFSDSELEAIKTKLGYLKSDGETSDFVDSMNLSQFYQMLAVKFVHNGNQDLRSFIDAMSKAIRSSSNSQDKVIYSKEP